MPVIRGKSNLEQFLEANNSPLAMSEGPDFVTVVMQDRSRPRQPTATPSPADVANFIDTAADTLSKQRVARGRASDLAAEKARIKRWLQDTPPDPEEVKKPRSKKKRRRTPASDTPKSAKEWLEQAAKVLTERRIKAGEKLDFNDAFRTSLNELKDGIFNPLHWIEAELLTTDYLQTVPESGPDPKNRSYAYPDPSNVRTLATYGTGSAGSAPARYSGNSVSGHFVDTLLVWKRQTFKFKKGFQPGEIEPIFIEINGTITAYADQRGSAPMLSYISKTWNVKTASSRLTTTTPPTDKPWSFYWRYKVPDTAPPFYHTEHVRKAIRTMRQPKHEETDGKLEKAVVLIAPRPMYGRGFNNNTGITTQFDPTVKIWQIKPPQNLRLIIADQQAGAILWDGNSYTVLHDYTTEPTGDFFPRAIAAGPSSYCAALTDYAEFRFYDRNWTQTAVVNRGLFLPCACAFLDGLYWTATQPIDPTWANSHPDTTKALHLYSESGELVRTIATNIWGGKTLTEADGMMWVIGRAQFTNNKLNIEQYNAAYELVRSWSITISGTIDFYGIAASTTHVYVTMGAYVVSSGTFIRKYTLDGEYVTGSMVIPPDDSVDGDYLTALQGVAVFNNEVWAVDQRDNGSSNPQLVKYRDDLTIDVAYQNTVAWPDKWFNCSIDRYSE